MDCKVIFIIVLLCACTLAAANFTTSPSPMDTPRPITKMDNKSIHKGGEEANNNETNEIHIGIIIIMAFSIVFVITSTYWIFRNISCNYICKLWSNHQNANQEIYDNLYVEDYQDVDM